MVLTLQSLTVKSHVEETLQEIWCTSYLNNPLIFASACAFILQSSWCRVFQEVLRIHPLANKMIQYRLLLCGVSLSSARNLKICSKPSIVCFGASFFGATFFSHI